MNQINELPSPTDFGLNFNYAVWTPGTVAMLCNVPWNADYRDVVRFSDQAALDTYLTAAPGPKVTITGMTYARVGQPIRIDIPFNAAYKYNYLRVFNPAQPVMGNDEPKSFYYFINNVNYLAPNTTELQIQLDVWQTFGYGITMGNCYVERGHIGIANENNFDDYGREFLTVPEGLDVGGEYRIEKQYVQQVADARGAELDDSTGNYAIMVISATNLAITDPGTKDDPNLETGPGSRMENLPNGATIFIFNPTQFTNFVVEFKDKPWITQGIMSISVIPPNGIYWSDGTQVDIGETAFATIPDPISLDRRKTPVAPEWRDTVNLGRYSNLKKFLTYPYCVMELTSYTGTPLLLKPESWNDPDGHVMELPHFAPPNPRLAFYPYRYNASGVEETTDEMGVLNDGGEFLDMQTGILNFPQFSIVNDGGIAYLAANANNIAYQTRSADWGQQKSMTGATKEYNQNSEAINTSRDVNAIGINASQRQAALANQTAGYKAIQAGANNVIGADVLGVANNIADYAIQTNQTELSNSISTSASAGANRAQNQNAGYNRDTNLDYASFANKGDYENTIAGIQAKIQDAALIQPTTAGQVGGDAFLLAVYKWGYDLKLKMLGGAAMNAVGEYWLRYGYQTNRFSSMPNNFMVMENFTYWKLRETYITGANCPEGFKQAIRGIFEKGVTVWSDPANIGTIDLADNAPLEGIVL